ncbi:MAG: 6-phosphogluconolactonase [Ignavibacteriales bacterium]|nr:6-phosphogluconolactonase [Ignavibacteriales bacterium]
MKNTNIKVFPDIEQLAGFIVRHIAEKSSVLPDGEYLTIALSGGTTPELIFECISANFSKLIDWRKLKIFWGDERCVPQTHTDSNFRMADESLLSKVPIPAKNIFRIIGERQPAEEAIRYADVLRANCKLHNNIPALDFVLLGLGEDGHTASIFPTRLDLFTTNELCAAVKHPQSSQDRITITGAVIKHARHIMFIVTGEKKAQMVETITCGINASAFPASHVASPNGKVTWLLDNGSALHLSARPSDS